MVAAQVEGNNSQSSEKTLEGSIPKPSKPATATELPEVTTPLEQAKLTDSVTLPSKSQDLKPSNCLTTDAESKSNHLVSLENVSKGPGLKSEGPAVAVTNFTEIMHPTASVSGGLDNHEILSKTVSDTLPITDHGYILRKKKKKERDPVYDFPSVRLKKRRKQNCSSRDLNSSDSAESSSKYKRLNDTFLRFLHLSGNPSFPAEETLPSIPVLKANGLINLPTATADIQPENKCLQSVESVSEVSISKTVEPKTAVTNLSEIKNASVSVKEEFNTHKATSLIKCNALPLFNPPSIPSKQSQKVIGVKFNPAVLQVAKGEKNIFSSNSNSSAVPKESSWKPGTLKDGSNPSLHLSESPQLHAKVSLPSSVPVLKSNELTNLATATADTQPENKCSQSMESVSEVSISKTVEPKTAVTNLSEIKNASVSVNEEFNTHKATSIIKCNALPLFNPPSIPSKQNLKVIAVKFNPAMLQVAKGEKNIFSSNSNSSAVSKESSGKPGTLKNGSNPSLDLSESPQLHAKVSLPSSVPVLKSNELTNLTTVGSYSQPESSHSQSMERLSKVPVSKSLEPTKVVTSLSEATNPSVLVSGGFNDHKTSNTTKCDALSSSNPSSISSKEKQKKKPIFRSYLASLQAKKEGKRDNLNSSGINKVTSWGSKAPNGNLNRILQQLKNPSLFARVSSATVSALKPAESTNLTVPMQTQLPSPPMVTAPVTGIVQAGHDTEESCMQENCSDSLDLNCAESIDDDLTTDDSLDIETIETINKETDQDVNTSFSNKEQDEICLLADRNSEDVNNGSVGSSCILHCRSIRIGSYKIYPPDDSSYLSVYITPGCFFFRAPSIKTSSHLVPLKLKTPDIVAVLAHLGVRLPIMFMFTTAECAARVRNQLGMVKRKQAYFDPKSKDQRKKIITFLIDDMNEKLQTYLCSTFPGKMLKQVERKEANELLLKSSPNQRRERKIDLDRIASRKKIPEGTNSHMQEHRRPIDSVNQLSDNDKTVAVSDARVSSAEKGYFVCMLCMKLFNDNFEYTEHLKIHSDKDYICHVCDKKFAHEDNLRDHTAACHEIEKSFVCVICSLEFSEECDFSQHMELLHGNMCFECEICKNRYSQKKFLMTHMQDHDNENLFQCEICKTFRAKGAHERHMTLHSKAKSFICEMCNLNCTKRSEFLLHAQQVHDVKRLYQCSYCQEFYFKENSLLQHLVQMHKKTRETQKVKCVVKKFRPSYKVSKQQLEQSSSCDIMGKRKRHKPIYAPQSPTEAIDAEQSEQSTSCDIMGKRNRHKPIYAPQSPPEAIDAEQSEQSASCQLISKKNRDKPIYAPENSIRVTDVQKNYLEQKKEQLGHVLGFAVSSHAQTGSHHLKPSGTPEDMYILESPAAAMTNYLQSTESAILVPVTSTTTKTTLLDGKHPNWFVRTCGKLCSKKDDQRKIFTYFKTNPSCNKISTDDEQTTFISSFEIEPKEDAGLLFEDDNNVDPLPSPSKLQQEFHQAVQPLSWLVGCWTSITASASYAAMKTVPYREEMQFFSTMQNVLQYNSETWHAETDELMHCESGFLNVDPTSKAVAFVVTHSFGVSELSEGTLICDKTMLTLKSKSISRMSFMTNRSLTEIVRCFELKGDVLTSEVSIATVSQPLQAHLVVKYEKVC